MGGALREFSICICTIADRRLPQKFSSAGLDKNECLDYNEFVFELNI